MRKVLVPSQFPSRPLKKFFVRVPSSISQHGEKANGEPVPKRGFGDGQRNLGV